MSYPLYNAAQYAPCSCSRALIAVE